MEMQKNLEKLGCSFYKVEGTDIQVCITDNITQMIPPVSLK